MTGGDGAVSRRRFTVATVVGLAVAAVPFLWVLWDRWTGHLEPLRRVPQSNFFDLQAKAMLNGHLSVPKGALGLEAFVHNGHEYTYFGLFPSLLRMPIQVVTHHFDGRLTAPSMLLAWIVTGVFCSMLVWRVRVMLRGSDTLGWVEASSYGILVAVVTSGSVLLFLASAPSSFHEDLAWSVALTIASLFALLGVLQRPSWGGVLLAGFLILLANLTRSTTGWSCVIAAFLMAVWFQLGRGGDGTKKWALPVVGIGVIPLAIGAMITYAKFGVFFGLPMTEQVYTHVNAYRREFLRANGNSEIGLQFLPSNLVAYLQPAGVRISSVFPFVTLPANPAKAYNGQLFDRLYRTSSLPASMPLLFGLGIWGVVIGLRKRVSEGIKRIRILILASAASGAAIFIWGYIANRYLADFLPFLALAGAAGLVDIWRRWSEGSRRTRGIVIGAVAALGLFSFVANIGIAISPSEYFTPDQARRFVEAQQKFSDLTGGQLEDRVVHGTVLPPRAPGDQIFIAGDCAGLYISNGEDLSPDPTQVRKRGSWTPIERGRPYVTELDLTFSEAAKDLTEPVPLMSIGKDQLVARVAGVRANGKLQVGFQLRVDGKRKPITGFPIFATFGVPVHLTVVSDPNVHAATVAVGSTVLNTIHRADRGPVVVHTEGAPGVKVVDANRDSPQPKLCRSLESR